VDPSDPQALYAGTVEALYTSRDGGETWRRRALGSRPITTFALAVDPQDSQVVYAGTTDGVYQSTDGGKTWQVSKSANQPQMTVTALTVDAVNGTSLYAGTEHHGVYRSSDGGGSWEQWGLPRISVYAIVLDRTGGVVWLGTEEGIFQREMDQARQRSWRRSGTERRQTDVSELQALKAGLPTMVDR